MSFNVANLFERLKEEPDRPTASKFTDEDILKPEPGNTYVLRLLFLPPVGDSKRALPMVNQYYHSFWDNSLQSNKGVVVYCPTSEYISGNNGFKECPICDSAQRFYKDSQTSASAKELYKKAARTFKGYIPVYVVSGPDDIVGKVKILRYPKTVAQFFDHAIFNKSSYKRDDQPQVDLDEVIGKDAFSYEDDTGLHLEAYNFILEVTSKKVDTENGKVNMPQYKCSFSRKMSKITQFGENEIKSGYFEELSKNLDFDKKYMRTSTREELMDFNLKYISTLDVTGSSDTGSSYDQATESSKETQVTQANDEQPKSKDDLNDIDDFLDSLDKL